MKSTTSSAVLATVALLASSARAQTEMFGRWHDIASFGTTFELYVAPGGNDTTGAINNPTQPFKTITGALAFAAQFNIPTTINIFPGSYVPGAVGVGETFPLRIPAHGITLESLDVKDRALAPVSILPGAGSGEAILVDRIGTASFPDSVIRGLDIQPLGPDWAIKIDPQGTMNDRTEVEIRDNYIHGTACEAGIDVEITDGRVAMDVLEGNWIVTEKEHGGVLGVRIRHTAGISSTLLRSNQIARFEENVEINGPFALCRPRLFSNLIQVAEVNVLVQDAHPILINNTIAWAFNYTTQPAVFGILGGGSARVELLNNLIWNPDQGANALAVDLSVLVGQNVANVVEDLAPAPTPMFVSGDSHPGLALFSVLPRCKDLHLKLTSPFVDVGSTLAFFDPANTPPIPIDTVAGIAIRRDDNLDVDYDPRGLSRPIPGATPIPDIGGDEVTDGTRLQRTPFPAGPAIAMDVFGNVRPISNNGTTMDHSTSVDILTPTMPGNTFACLLFLGAGFNTTIPSLGVENRSLYEDSVIPGFGQIALDIAPSNALLLGVGTSVGGGTIMMAVDTPPISLAFDEAEAFLQGVVIETNPAGATVSVRVTNRMLIELNQ